MADIYVRTSDERRDLPPVVAFIRFLGPSKEAFCLAPGEAPRLFGEDDFSEYTLVTRPDEQRAYREAFFRSKEYDDA